MDQTSETKEPMRGDSAGQAMEEFSTGLPGFKTWRGVYYFVIVVFLVCVVLLKAFELAFS